MATIAFIGGGNMATAIIGGLIGSGRSPRSIIVLDPDGARRDQHLTTFGIDTLAVAEPVLADALLVVWAVKPQLFASAVAPCAPFVSRALQLSVMAGIRSDAIAAASGSERVVRAMPNTPALIAKGIAGLYARPSVGDAERREVEAVIATTGEFVWVDTEDALDPVTAVSGSGPAYVFYLLEAMIEAGVGLGLGAADARRLAQQTIAGAAALAAGSDLSPETLRHNVTSRGGTTQAAIDVLDAHGVKAALVAAIRAAAARSRELGEG